MCVLNRPTNNILSRSMVCSKIKSQVIRLSDITESININEAGIWIKMFMYLSNMITVAGALYE